MNWKLDEAQQKPDSLADAFVELRQLCAEKDYILETPIRSDRDCQICCSKDTAYLNFSYDRHIDELCYYKMFMFNISIIIPKDSNFDGYGISTLNPFT